MTTVAWDGEVLAADSQVGFGNLTGYFEKVCKLPDGRLLASCGDAQDHHQVREWLAAGGFLQSPGPPKPTLDKDHSSILIDADGAWVIQSALCRWPLPRPKWAIGSGRDFAITAMHLGHSARDAVAVAIEFDGYTGGPVHAVSRDP